MFADLVVRTAAAAFEDEAHVLGKSVSPFRGHFPLGLFLQFLSGVREPIVYSRPGANLSAQLGRSLTWDAGKHQVTGDEEATKLLRREYRKPWVHPEPVS